MTFAHAQAESGAAGVADFLQQIPSYSGRAQFDVYLPQADDPVTYVLRLQSAAAEGDTLAPCRYLIDWSTVTPAGEQSGFSAYFGGDHYRYRNNRIQEYHYDDAPESFAPSGYAERGVQQTAQFADVLPQFIGRKFAQMLADSAYVVRFHADTLVDGHRSIVIEGSKQNAGYTTMEFQYVLDAATRMPVSSNFVNSPGLISEQIVDIKYAPGDAEAVEYSEDYLIERYPEAFERYRRSAFRTENLVGTLLPDFTAKYADSTGDGRYTYQRGDGFAAPTVIAVLDPEVVTTEATIDAISRALSQLPMHVDFIAAFNTNRADALPAAADATRLISISPLVRNCGISFYPTVIIADRTGKVVKVISGFNKNLTEDVIQQTIIL